MEKAGSKPLANRMNTLPFLPVVTLDSQSLVRELLPWQDWYAQFGKALIEREHVGVETLRNYDSRAVSQIQASRIKIRKQLTR